MAFSIVYSIIINSTRLEHNLKNPLSVSAACWHDFVAALPSGDFFSSIGLAAKSSAHSFKRLFTSKKQS